jgi:hypothetical protein
VVVQRSLGELALIVVGVLLALGAESLWSERADRAREQSYLEQIAADARENGRRLEDAIVVERGLIEGSRAALLALDAAGRVHAADSVDAWLNLRRSSFLPVTGAFRALINAGDLELVEDPGIRAALIDASDTFASSMEDLRVLDAASLDLLRDLVALSFRHTVRDAEGSRLNVRAVTDDAALRELVVMKRVYNANRVEWLTRMSESNERLLTLVEARLADG